MAAPGQDLVAAVTRSRRGTWAYYRAVPERLAALADVISTPQPV
jgi:hypothetical protein